MGPRGYLVARLRPRRDRDLIEAVANVEAGLLSDYLRAGLRQILRVGLRDGIAPPPVPRSGARVEAAKVPLGGEEAEVRLGRMMGVYLGGTIKS